MKKHVRIVEVGPRDGLQNEKSPIPTADKIALIQKLNATGLPDIEITSFVSPKAIPQLADSREVAQTILTTPQAGVTYWALVPNMRGLESALDAGITHIAVFTAASETFNQKNINKSIAEAFDAFKPVIETAKAKGIVVRGYVSTAFWCPYEGKIDKEPVREVSKQLLQMGIQEISIGDTIGKATPDEVRETVGYLLETIPQEKLAMHFHDTYGHAIANIEESLKLGISIFDASVGGVGGCPYAPGASGNVSTEAVVRKMQQLGIETGIDLPKLDEAGRFILEVLNRARAGAV